VKAAEENCRGRSCSSGFRSS